MINHRKSWLAALLAATAVAVVPAGVTAKSDSSTSAGLQSFHGTVTSVSTADKTFRIKRSGAGTLTVRVTATTVLQRLGGRLSALRAGRAVEVKARRADGVWTARKVERDDAGADHDAGDDHGSGGHGADD